MEEGETVTLKVDPNEANIITVMFDGNDLAKLKAYQQFLQNELDKAEDNEVEISLSQTIKVIVVNELEDMIDVVK
jgi:hypothetical protein